MFDMLPNAGKAKLGCGLLSSFMAFFGLVFLSVMTTLVVSIGIWPGEMKLTAPILCPDEKPDPYVVSDTYSPQPGESSTTYTLYCVGERGDFEDVGVFRPMALLTLFHAGLWLAIPFVLAPIAMIRRRARQGVGGEATVKDRPGGDTSPPDTSRSPAPQRTESAGSQNPVISGGVDDGPVIGG